jgi:uncharacterized protein (DUF4213/DUF364 family)
MVNTMYTSDKPILESARIMLEQIISQHELFDAPVCVRAKILSPFEAIGEPDRKDYPIIEGQEKVIEAHLLGSRGQAFTDAPGEQDFTIEEILTLPLTSNRNRAFFVATLNAVMRHLDRVEATIHCKNNEPELCAKEITQYIRDNWGNARIGLIGLNPAIAEELMSAFGPDNIKITDLNKKNFKTTFHEVPVWDGRTETEKLISGSDVIVVTGTTLVNGTFDFILSKIREHEKHYLIYGITGAGICALFGLNRMCPYGKNA